MSGRPEPESPSSASSERRHDEASPYPGKIFLPPGKMCWHSLKNRALLKKLFASLVSQAGYGPAMNTGEYMANSQQTFSTKKQNVRVN